MADNVVSEASNPDINSHTINCGIDRRLIEYQWPSTKEGDFFVLHENAVSFLGVDSSFLKGSGKKMDNF